MSGIPDRTPVLVGVAALSQRCDDWRDAREPLELLVAALEAAAADAASRALLARADRIAAPRGFWDYADPCRIVAERFGAARARTEIAEIGVLQTTLVGRAAAAIAAGEADVVLVAGAEARHRAQRAKFAGESASMTALGDTSADTVLRPHAPVVSAAEIRAGIVLPVMQYAMIENALRAAERVSIEKHRAEIAALWTGFADVARANPDAWVPDGPNSAALLDEVRNPMQAFPYGKHHVSQWNVDQAAGLIFCSAGTARALGIPRSKWIFPRAVADANHMIPFTERRVLARCAGFGHTGRRALDHAGVAMADVAHRELYSCFPVAVRLQQRELAIDDAVRPTVTGGMAFAGGPLNHFTFHALVRLAGILRQDPGSTGYLSAVSGILTKQGASVWSSEPGARPFAFDDVTDATARDTEGVALVENASGDATIATYSVVHDARAPRRTVLLCDFEDGRRTIAQSNDPALADLAESEELCGRRVRIRHNQPEILS